MRRVLPATGDHHASPAPATAAQNATPVDIYLIGCGAADAPGAPPSVESMGFKAWNLRRMAQLELPVPPAFVIGSRYCVDPAQRERAASAALWSSGLHALERASGQVLGDVRRPLLVSVRSGAPVSMPGMMETLLNIGLCDATVGGLLRQTGNPRLVWDAYRRLVAMYGEVVAGIPARAFEEAAERLFGRQEEAELDFSDLRALTARYIEVYAMAAGQPFPQDPVRQLSGAIAAVFASWQSPRAREYRRLNRIDDGVGTAVTVQRMVFGNAGGMSGAGVGFTRDPTDGTPAPWVDFLFNAQGEDVVSGRRSAHGHDELASVLPDVWTALIDAGRRLEQAFGDMQDFEFTVHDGHLYLLQARSGKRTARARARIALDMLDEGLIDARLALERCAGLDREALALQRIVAGDGAALVPLGRAASAGSGVAIGEIALDALRAAARARAGVPVILVRQDAETQDIAALESAQGLLTQRGARTSHAAVVARQLGKVCLIGCADLRIDERARAVDIAGTRLCEGEILTLDGNEGWIYRGALRLTRDYPMELLERLERLRTPVQAVPPTGEPRPDTDRQA
jgi:pyruvate,orthophosphate dikinase